MTGEILNVTAKNQDLGSGLQHDAVTSAGTAGSPVILLGDTPTVVAIHLGGNWTGDRKVNVSVSTEQLLKADGFRKTLGPGAKIDGVAVPLNLDYPDPLGLKTDAPLIVPYDPSFLSRDIPLPKVRPNVNGTLLSYFHYSLLYDPLQRTPIYAAANVDCTLLRSIVRPKVFFSDPRLKASEQVDSEMFQANHWDRGHLVARTGVTWGSDSETASLASKGVFYFPNIMFQYDQFNRGPWLRLESKVILEKYPESPRVSYFCGPVMADLDIESHGQRIPQRFWLVAFWENLQEPSKPHYEAYLSRQYRLSEGRSEPQFVQGDRHDWTESADLSQIAELTGLEFIVPR
jgi:DNA/RNA endonuclease G (NUC1)